MEDDEDCYGFGALSDMFDDRRGAQTTTTSTHASPAPAEVVKRLDVAAMSRYWWSERKLNDFRRRQREEGDATKEYQHIAAKFDGQRVEGGLGSAFVVEASSQSDKGGLLWIQSQTSDSNAQARRKKEIQDITNRLDLLRTPNGGAKSSAAVYVDMDEIVTAKATTVQHTVKAIKFELRDGSSLELVFMPGPFFDAQHRDEFLKLFAEVQEGRRDSSRSPPTHTGITISATRPSLEDTSTAQATASAPTPTVSEPLNDSHKAMIRQYVQQSETQTESIDIAKKIQAETGYHIGPLSRDGPKFSEDTDYRKKTVERLSKALERMNEDWRVDEQEREERTKARSSKDSDDAFQYRDVTTNEMLSLDAYRHRYLDYIGAHHEHPILRLVPPPPAPRHQTPKHKSSKSKSKEGSTTQLSTLNRIETVSSVVGFDISRSCIIDEDFLHLLRHRSDMMADPTADSDDNKLVADARVALWSTLAGALENYHHVTSQVQKDSKLKRHQSETTRLPS
ncbi:hypothetical protein Poli38472_005102 [Pythium oligandrum]|uniref:Uncharacterized protein n=1 Tax=Pythium oligandrum TaxID=41045 RepID=A0A8K1CFG1_PYTOL|nr:hypothetical protein Poli38472_005102 [Pythium oligandrum]|eukprot:TMW62484.1 hypothetical protein Poli38472_005102 [Pythium oligandrum]